MVFKYCVDQSSMFGGRCERMPSTREALAGDGRPHTRVRHPILCVLFDTTRVSQLLVAVKLLTRACERPSVHIPPNQLHFTAYSSHSVGTLSQIGVLQTMHSQRHCPSNDRKSILAFFFEMSVLLVP